jgi:hypothetical protein
MELTQSIEIAPMTAEALENPVIVVCWGCGGAAVYFCGKYALCETCSEALAKEGGAP